MVLEVEECPSSFASLISLVQANNSNADLVALDGNGRPERTAKSNEPMWCLSTDSPRVMEALRRAELRFGLVMLVFGCSPHAMHNMSFDWLESPVMKCIISMNAFIVKKINSVHLLTIMFDVLCAKKFHKAYYLIMFTKSRWAQPRTCSSATCSSSRS